MVRSRTIRVLFALLIAMTVGALALMVLQTNPIRPPAQFAAIADGNQPGPVEAVFDTAIPLQPTKWRNIVLHGSQAEHRNVADQCHFVIGESGAVVVTALWKQQISGQHVSAAGRDWNIDSIEEAVRAAAAEADVGLGKIAQPLRAALTGRTASPGIFDVLCVLGRTEAMDRISDQVGPAA